jgi:hypothetical protein
MYEKWTIVIEVDVSAPIKNANVGLSFFNTEGIATDTAFSWDDEFYLTAEEAGTYEIEFEPSAQLSLSPGSYAIGLGLNQHYNTMGWDGIQYYPVIEIENKGDIRHWETRPWAIHHLQNNNWTIKKSI